MVASWELTLPREATEVRTKCSSCSRCSRPLQKRTLTDLNLSLERPLRWLFIEAEHLDKISQNFDSQKPTGEVTGNIERGRESVSSFLFRKDSQIIIFLRIESLESSLKWRVFQAISRTVASLPPEKMFELMKQMRDAVRLNPNEVKNMLIQNPQLSYALLQVTFITYFALFIIDQHYSDLHESLNNYCTSMFLSKFEFWSRTNLNSFWSNPESNDMRLSIKLGKIPTFWILLRILEVF